ncbi:MAG: ribonuclease P protein component [Archangium sp.]|nr:ribonuclease P protein component [Archangium sp.]MDP3573588.1 ribonuclease P protein component [Archangium sp.]
MPAEADQPKQHPFSFPKELRLRRRSEFLRVQDKGHKITADCLLCLVLPNGTPDRVTRLGLTVSTKVGPSVVRNRIRRRLRELFRVRKASLPQGLDMVFIARSSAREADWPRMVRAYERIERELGQKFKRV